jgi:microcystin-dependent protein
VPVSFWSPTTPALNAQIDPTINLSSGRSPSSVTPADRAILSAIAQYRQDVAGSTVTSASGTSTAYILSTFSNFNQAPAGSTALQNLASQQIAFSPNITNGQGSPSVTLTVDGLGPFPVRSAPNTELLPGTIIAGTPYVVLFNPTDSAFYLQGFFGQQSVPLGGVIEYTGSTSPYSNFVFPIGQQVSITAYASLYSLYGPNRYGADTSSLFFLPDLRGRVTAMLDPGNSTGRLTAVNASVLGSAGGEQSHTLGASEIPAIGVSVSVSGALSGVTTSDVDVGIASENTGGGQFPFLIPTGQEQVGVSVSGSMSGSGSSTNTGGAAHNNVQPTIVLTKLLRIQ